MYRARRFVLSLVPVLVVFVVFMTRPSSATIAVLDYYRLGDADVGAAHNTAANATTSDSAGTKPLTRIGSPVYTNAVAFGPSSRQASQLGVTFNGSAQGFSNNVVVSTLTDNWGIEAWACPLSLSAGGRSIVYNGHTGTSGWGIYQDAGNFKALFGGIVVFGSAPITLGGWSHLALVRSGGTTIFYLNGFPVATNTSTPNIPAGGFCIAMPGQGGIGENFIGHVDEVRVFTFAPGQFSTNDLSIYMPIIGPVPPVPLTMNTSLQTDLNGNGRVNLGDTLRYAVIVRNNTNYTLTNVVFNSSAVPNAPLVAGSLRATPLARADGPSANSVPGNAWHGATNATLTVSAGSGLLANDFLGLPAATLLSFGGGSFGGTVSANVPGTTVTNLAVGSLKVNADGSLTFTPVVGFTGLANFQYRLVNSVGTNDGVATLAMGNRPVATGDFYPVTGNTMLDSSLIPTTIPKTLLANDTGDVMAVASVTQPTHGAVSLTSFTGNFLYTPAAGYTGPDSFTYTITNGFGSSVGTVNLTVANLIWYIDNSVAVNGDGRSSSPFKDTSDFSAVNDGAAGHPANNDLVFLRQGAGVYTGTATLRNRQQFFGDGLSGPLGSVFGFSLALGSAKAPGVVVPGFTGTRPNIQASGGGGVSLNSDNIVAGINVACSNGTALFGNSVGNLVLSNVIATAVGGTAVSVSGGFVNVTLDAVYSTNSQGYGVALQSLGGTANINGGNIVNGQAAALAIFGGIVDVTCKASMSQGFNSPLMIIEQHSVGTITFQGGALSVSNNSPGLLFFNADGNYNFFGTVTCDGSFGGIDIENDFTGGSSGNFTFNNASITNVAGVGFKIIGSNPTVIYNGSIAKSIPGQIVDIENCNGGSVVLNGNINANNVSYGILVQNCTGGAFTFSGPSKLLNTGANPAVNLVNNNGATINFTGGGLAIATASTGFNATGGGTINVTGPGNTINCSTASALNIVNTAIGSSGLTFQSITSTNGSGTGIILDGTGVDGGLTVTGTGSPGSGGTIANKTGADGSTTTGIGIYLNNCSSVSLSRMQLNDFQNFAIRGFNVNGFALSNSVINGVNGNNAGVDEASVAFDGLTESASFVTDTIQGSIEDTFRVFNTNGTLNRLTVDGCTFGAQNTATGNAGLFLRAQGSAVLNATVKNSNFTFARGDHFQINLQDAAQSDLIFQSNVVANPTTNAATISGGGITINGGNAGSSLALTYDINGNTFTNSRGNAIDVVFQTVGANGSMNGRIRNNRIGNPAVNASGSLDGSGIQVGTAGTSGSQSLTISNNLVCQFSQVGIALIVGANTNGPWGGFAVTMDGNTVSNPSTFANGSNGILLFSGAQTGDAWQPCIDIRNNTTAGSGTGGSADILVLQRVATTVRLPGYAGSPTDTEAVQAFLGAQNTGSEIVNAVITVPPGGGFVGGAACGTP
jgi:uncharacterized repeat protein (TIGR01451 family)